MLMSKNVNNDVNKDPPISNHQPKSLFAGFWGQISITLMNIYQVIFEKRDDNLKRLKLYPDWPCVARLKLKTRN